MAYTAFRLVMFGHRENELRPETMTRLRYAVAAGIAAALGGVTWPVTLLYLVVRMTWHRRGSSDHEE